MSSDMRNLRIEAMYLCGWSIWDIAKALSGAAVDKRGRPRAYGQVNGFVTTRNLWDSRNAESRPRRLVELGERTPKMRKIVDDLVVMAVRSIADDLRLGRVKQEDHQEALARKRLAKDIASVRSIPPEERDVVPERFRIETKRKVRIRNQDDELEDAQPLFNLADSTLGWLGSHGIIRPECVDAGERMCRDFHACGFRFGSVDPTRPIAKGSGSPSGRSDSSLDASQRFNDALEAVRHAFPSDEIETRLALLDHVVIRDLYLGQLKAMPAHLARRRGELLDETLLAVAWSYGTLENGPVAKLLQDRRDRLRREKKAG